MPQYSTHAFAEKVALITDGGNSYGRAIALQLALYGTFVIVGYHDPANRSAMEELKSLGTLAGAFKADTTSAAGALSLVSEVEDMFGRLDLLINTLKLDCDSDFLDTREDSWNKHVAAGLRSPFFVTQEAMRLMRPRPKPRIVNLAFAEKKTSAEMLRAGVVGLTRSLAEELAPEFRVNCVEVGGSDKIDDVELDAELFRSKSGAAEDDVARTVLFLLSSESVGLNGQILKVE